MTVTNETTTKALAILDRCNLNAAKSGQAVVWAQVMNDAIPLATDATLIAAVKAIAATRTSDGKGGSWVTVGDLIAKMRVIRHLEAEARDRQVRQIEASVESTGVDVKKLMANALKSARTTTKEETP